MYNALATFFAGSDKPATRVIRNRTERNNDEKEEEIVVSYGHVTQAKVLASVLFLLFYLFL
jgi:hypothetical protein